MFNNILLWQATEVLEVSHFYFGHYFWSKYKTEKVAIITLELNCLHPQIWCKSKWKQQGHSKQFGLGCIPAIYLKCFHVSFPLSTIVSNVISKPSKILPFKLFSFFFFCLKCFINHRKTVPCHRVIANCHAKERASTYPPPNLLHT